MQSLEAVQTMIASTDCKQSAEALQTMIASTACMQSKQCLEALQATLTRPPGITSDVLKGETSTASKPQG
jgi:hypothetical protein